MKSTFKKSLKAIWYGKRVQIFYLSLEFKNNFHTNYNNFKQLLSSKTFCRFLTAKNKEKLGLINQQIKDEEEYFLKLNKDFEPEKLQEILNGDLYDIHIKKVFGDNYLHRISNYITEYKDESFRQEFQSANFQQGTEEQGIQQKPFDPFRDLEKSVNLFDIDYKSLNTYNYFLNYGKFINSLVDSKPNPTSSPEEDKNNKNIDDSNIKMKNESERSRSIDKSIITYIECLCKMYIGHNLHYKIEEKISKKTNLFILKGDYFFSLGYYTVCKIGNPVLIKYYSKISEILSSVSYYLI